MKECYNKIHVEASVSYDIWIGKGLLEEAEELLRTISGVRKAVIVSDDNVYPLYGPLLEKALKAAGIQSFRFVFPHGEESKNLSVYGQLLEFISECRLTRSDLLAALGGGVTGDLCGFAAATYQRGIRYIQVPTSLLAAVDSSVGGKTAVNLKGGKNQAGCFYQPSMVICDTKTLATLPEREYQNGCAEVIKYGMIKDKAFFRKLGEKPASAWIEEVIGICAAMKRDVAMEDEFDTGARMLLNFGHTLGHGVEKSTHYQISHGYAVAMGMAAITDAAVRNGVCSPSVSGELKSLLKAYGLPCEMTVSKEELLEAAALDKKNQGNSIRMIVPEDIGRCVIRTIDQRELPNWV